MTVTDVEPYTPRRGFAPEGDDSRRCTAKSSQTGQRCGRWAMEGQKVCPFHGGSHKASRRKAQLKLMDLIGPATGRLEKILRETTDERVALKAVEMIYDRTGLESKKGGVDAEMAREILLQRIMDARQERSLPPTDQEDDSDEEIFDAEVVEDKPDVDDLLRDLL